MVAARTHIDDWLAERGMSEYAELFAKQKIDLNVLGQLTEQDLRELGVALGDRRKILGWIAGLNNVPGAAKSNTSASQAAPSPEALSAERRQVTVLFSDIVDSTGLSRRLDPEDVREVIRAYQEAVTRAVKHYDGFVAGFRGDGVLVYFGYPQAHEDDTERAVRAALELVPAVSAIQSAEPLKTRVGIATGLVVVGDLIGSGDTSERNMVGDAPNLAARLLSLAEPNSVVLADEAREMLGDFFDFEDLGLRHVKGIEQPVRSWAVMKPRAVESRFEAMHGAALTEFSGRDDELQLLLKRWQKAKTGEGQVVLISGEPGIGKSRLTAALMEAIPCEPHARLRYFCSPQHTDSAFHPVIGHLERGAGFAHGDDAEVKLDKLEKLLTGNGVNAEGKSLVAALLSLPTERYPALDYDAAQRRAKTMEALHGQVVTLCGRNPVLMILEDAHWIDPTSHEAFGRTVEKLKGLPVLLVITYRPEFNAPWIGESHVTSITLNRLGNREASQIVASLAGNKPISAETVADIVDRSDGIPLFLEEMTKAVLETESETAARETVSASPSRAHAVPAILHASLMPRLDRLGKAKGTAQVGAAIGRSFSHALLAAVSSDNPDDLQIYLNRLISSGLVFRQGQPPDATYLFKHALIRDAAYSMLLREPRRALHARILEALETKFPDIAEAQPELLAHHAMEATQIEKAADYLRKAGERSLMRSAVAEGITQLRRAQDLLTSVPKTTETRKHQISIQALLAPAISQTRGYAAPETAAAYARIVSLIDEVSAEGEPDEWDTQLFFALIGLWGVHLVAYNQELERPLVTRLLELSEKHRDPFQLVAGHTQMAKSLYFSGEFRQALAHLDTALANYKPEFHRRFVTRRTHDSGVDALAYRLWTLDALGRFDAAQATSEQLTASARDIGHAYTLMFALHSVAWHHIFWTRDYTAAKTAIDELFMLEEEYEAPWWRASALQQRGFWLVISGKAEEAIGNLNSGLAAWTAMGATLTLPSQMSYLALAHGTLGNSEEARLCIDDALCRVETTKEKYFEAGILQIAGQVALLQPNPDPTKAECYWRRGLDFCRERSIRGTELCISVDLARLWHNQGKTREAYDLLQPLYNWFTEGFGTAILKEAKALLEELRIELG